MRFQSDKWEYRARSNRCVCHLLKWLSLIRSSHQNEIGPVCVVTFHPPSPGTGYLTNFCFLATNYSSWCFSIWIPSYGAQLSLGVPVTPFPCRLEKTSLGHSGFLLQRRKWVHQLTELGSTFIGAEGASQDWLTVLWQEQVPKGEQSHRLHLLKGRGTCGVGRHKCAQCAATIGGWSGQGGSPIFVLLLEWVWSGESIPRSRVKTRRWNMAMK